MNFILVRNFINFIKNTSILEYIKIQLVIKNVL